MTTVDARAAAAAAAGVAARFDEIFAMIDGWRAGLAGSLAGDAALTTVELDPLVASFAIPAVSEETLVTGAGFVAAPGILADAAYHLAWWLRETAADRPPRRLQAVEDPANELFRDYTALEWWRVPAETGARHLTGPYVDYVCTDDYTVTITIPVVVGGTMVGMVGADALVDRLERELLPVLGSAPGPATIVNASARVVTSTDTHREPGSILRTPGLAEAVRHPSVEPVAIGDGCEVLACGDTSLALVVGC
ncbi:cache domain-containing protein [Microbacterium thalassium]|uniref:Cache domain-containing protein n=1 Tax=Microbacterium thalassium TaxID=362649 RepID=A0A7X0FMV4_9MICO|nr:cache domain-containing protein [Microbacterium thalassium]MBB6390414.1 hypothetical protein [Microbacterium thalassium]GLK25523.1 hypothetical protein GCM10017607_28420 [Microbacterium thalassium]